MIFTSWKELIEKVSALNEEELRHSINEEVASHNRDSFVKRMHQRYSKMRVNREREMMRLGMVVLK